MSESFLLDTHTFIWLRTRPGLVGKRASEAAGDPAAGLSLSSVSGYEMSYKYGRGRLSIAGPVLANLLPTLERLHITTLPVSMEDAVRAGELPDVHRDPFDRLLAAQALAHGLTLISADPAFDRLGVPRLW